MRTINFSIAQLVRLLLVTAVCLIAGGGFASLWGQEQPYQLNTTAKYVGHTAYDTVNVPYVKGSKTKGFISNEGTVNNLYVYFAYRDSASGRRDPNTYCVIYPGKSLRFGFNGKKIYRQASTDSVFSQVVFGEDMQMGSKRGSQPTSVFTLANITYPLTPYGNGWVSFNGVNQFMRTSYQPWTLCIGAVTDSCNWHIRFKLLPPTNSRMWIMGNYPAGYILAYSSNTTGKLEFYWNGWKDLLYWDLSTDTNWADLKIKYSHVNSTLKFYLADTLVSQFTSFTPTIGGQGTPLSIGNVGFTTCTSDPACGTSGGGWMKGYVDFLYISKWYNGSDTSGYWNFNEGAGQYAYDSTTYTLADRVLVNTGTTGSKAFESGWSEAPDSNDVTWSRGALKNGYVSNVVSQGTGLWKWLGGGNDWYAGSFLNGQCNWNGGIVYTAEINRGNKPIQGNYRTDNGDTMMYVAKWNGTNFQKVGSNELGPGGVQLFAWRDSILVIGGSFAKGIKSITPTQTTWQNVGKGFNNVVTCFTQDASGNLLAGGYFTADTAGGALTSQVASYNGTTWSAVGSSAIGTVWSLRYYNNVLYAGTANGLYKLVAGDWSLMRASNIVYCLTVYNSELWIGRAYPDTIYSYNGSTFTNRGITSGFTGDVVEMKVAPNGRDLYVIGSFFKIGNVVCNKLARYNGSVWSAVNYGFDLRGEDLSFYVQGGITYLAISGDMDASDGLNANTVCLIKIPQ